MSAADPGTSNDDDATLNSQLAALAGLPVELANVSEHQVLRTAASKLIEVYPRVRYIRILLVSQNYQPSEMLEWALDKQLTAAMSGMNGGNSSQQAAMRRGMSLHTQQLQPTSDAYDDWRLLQQRFGMQSFAAVPLMAAGTVHGVILAASPNTGCFTERSMQLLETAAHMLAPYAAVLYKYQQITVARGLLHQLLPARVVNAAIERLGLGGMSAVDLFVPTHFPGG